MDMTLTGRAALVTGGNIGIGRSIALALAEAGADVAVTYFTHPDPSVVEAIQAHSRRAVALKCDVTRSTEVDAAVQAVVDAFGRLDIVVANAGGLVGRVGLADMTDDHWRYVLDVNLTSVMYTARAAAPMMERGTGRIITVSSVAARHGGSSGTLAYSAAKAGLLGLTRSLAKELAPGITVNCVAPGLVLDTPFHDTFSTEPMKQAMIEGTLVKRAGYPDDVAGTVLFLASDLAGFITGEVIDVNGGAYFS